MKKTPPVMVGKPGDIIKLNYGKYFYSHDIRIPMNEILTIVDCWIADDLLYYKCFYNNELYRFMLHEFKNDFVIL